MWLSGLRFLAVVAAILAIPTNSTATPASAAFLVVTPVTPYQSALETAGTGTIQWKVTDTNPLDRVGYTITGSSANAPSGAGGDVQYDVVSDPTMAGGGNNNVFFNNPVILTENFTISGDTESPDNQDFGRWYMTIFVDWTYNTLPPDTWTTLRPNGRVCRSRRRCAAAPANNPRTLLADRLVPSWRFGRSPRLAAAEAASVTRRSAETPGSRSIHAADPPG